MQEFHSFSAIVTPQANILLLGSMPSIRSIRQQQYYAHPQNSFWPMLAQIYDEYLESEELESWQQGRHQQLPFQRKLALLEQIGIALWDVLASCQRQNSADQSIRNAVCNPIAEFVKSTSIHSILLNGQKSASLFCKHVTLPPGYRICTLPSSSPANATIPFPEKLAIWRSALREAQEFV